MKKTFGYTSVVIPMVLGLMITFQPNAHAYLDAGTGSIIFQAVIGVFLAMAMTAKMWWHRLTGLFFKHEDEEDEENDE
mgnify:CR=1 FL=1